MITSLTTYTAASDNSLTLAEAKADLKVDQSTDESLIALKLDAAERAVEEYTNRRFMKTVLDFTLSGFPEGGIVLPVSPVISVDSVKYYDGDNVQQTWAATNYWYNVSSNPTVIQYDSPPSVRDNRTDVVTVRFTVGYSNEAATATQQAAVPPPLKQAVLHLLNDLYYARQDAVRERFTAWKMQAYPYRVFHYAQEND